MRMFSRELDGEIPISYISIRPMKGLSHHGFRKIEWVNQQNGIRDVP
jgi:hypothetical protein